MSSTTATRSSAKAARSQSGLTFGGLLNSEWIKLRTLRSTFWCYLIIFVLTVGLGALISNFSNVANGFSGKQDLWVGAVTLGLSFGQLVVAVLGALVIAGEYGTGMIKTTMTAAPQRLPALFAKALVFGITTFVVGLVSIVITALVTVPILSAKSLAIDVGDGKAWLAFVGGAGYLALIGVLALGIGAILRNSAAGIASALGLILVVPGILSVIFQFTAATWVLNVVAFLPSEAGSKIFSYPGSGAPAGMHGGLLTLDSTQGLLVLIAWVFAVLVIASALVKRRDV
jgi:ABC-2 type transport system permease protein